MSQTPVAAAPPEVSTAKATEWHALVMWRRFLRHRFGIPGLAMVILMVLLALLAPVIAPHNPTVVFPNGLSAQGAPLGPDWHWNQFFLGTDYLGRDELSQLIWGARVSMEVGVFATIISLLIGTLFGAMSGMLGGWADNLLMRFTDIVLAFPFLLFVILLESVISHPTVVTVYTVIGVLGWAPIARIARGQTLSIVKLEYIEAARAIGVPFWKIVVRHVIPNIVSPLIVVATLNVANNIVLESALSFLGIGVPDPTPSWGKMISSALGIYQIDPLLLIFPGIALVIAVLGFNFIGDALNAALNPRQHTRWTA